jgi:hypothetical protein
MELSFVCANPADASYLAQELELELRNGGVPAGALSLKRPSQENMDIGSVLSISIDLATNILGPVGSIATLAKCIYEVVAKHDTTVLVVHSDGERVQISPAKANLKRIEKALTKSARTKAKPRLRA